MGAREGWKYTFIVATAMSLELRSGGSTDPVLVLGRRLMKLLPICTVEYGHDTDLEMAKALSAASCRLGKKAPVHIKVDTGMGRIGFRPDETAEIVSRVLPFPVLNAKASLRIFATSTAVISPIRRSSMNSSLRLLDRSGKKYSIPIPILQLGDAFFPDGE